MIKLNVDGARKTRSGEVAARGVLRNVEGNWRRGFFGDVGSWNDTAGRGLGDIPWHQISRQFGCAGDSC